jgi:prepilin-type N-terminal cleavage/methylation domain-containing protein
MTTLETGSRASGFTLVELLSVVAIMAIVMGVLGLSLRNMQGPSTQIAAAQVASGLSFARQLAISRNTETRFVIYGNTTGAAAPGLPAESWRYWTVIMTNKNVPNPAANVWIMQKDWEKLPEGTVFLDIASSRANYNTVNANTIPANIVGQPQSRRFQDSFGANENNWQGFTSYGPFNLAAPNDPTTVIFRLTQAPAIGFKGTGEAVECRGVPRGTTLSGGGQCIAVRLAEGASLPNGQVVLRSVDNYYYIESDKFGRVRSRARESYR